jgi:hypothetical protein
MVTYDTFKKYIDHSWIATWQLKILKLIFLAQSCDAILTIKV